MIVARWLPIGLLGLLAGPGPTMAQGVVTLDTLSLFGLPGVRVAVDFSGAEAKGLAADSLQSDIEAAVRDGGVRVFTEAEWQVTIGNPMLRLHVNLVQPSEHFYLFNLELEVLQLAVLARDSTIPSFGGTWAAGDVVGTVPAGQLGSLRQHAVAMVSQFLAAHAAANRMRRRWVRPAEAHFPTERTSGVWPNGVVSKSNRVRGSTETFP